ncbi:MAG: YqgE/AlgH family protein [Pirellulales bacterium]
MASLEGHLLIASPDLLDPNFVRTVLLIVRHDEEGALGLVLNRPTKTTLKEALREVHDTPCRRDDTLFLGGPCQGSLMALHGQPLLMEIEVLPTVFFSADSDHLEQLIAESNGETRFFVGFSGWAAGQLESELQTGSWRTAAARPEHIFSSSHDSLWRTVSREIVSSVLLSALKIKHVPHDPSMN